MTKQNSQPRPAQARRRLSSYPAAPTDPSARREYFARRNAALQGVPYEDYIQGIAEQKKRQIAFSEQQSRHRDVRD